MSGDPGGAGRRLVLGDDRVGTSMTTGVAESVPVHSGSGTGA
jgi:hypothetical protein